MKNKRCKDRMPKGRDVTGLLNVVANGEGQDETCRGSHVSKERDG